MASRNSSLREREMEAAFDPVFQVNRRVRKIGEAQSMVASHTRGTNQKIQEAKDTLAARCKPYHTEIDRLLSEIFAIARDHHRELTKGKRKKIIKLIAGIIWWRFTPYGTNIKDVKKVIKWMERHGYGKYLRWVPEIDRQLLVRDRTKIKDKIPGVTIGRTELFGAEPSATETAVALPVKRLEHMLKKRGKPFDKK